MLELRYIRENLEFVKEKTKKRGIEDAKLDTFATIDAERRKILAEVESLRNQRKTVSQEIAKLKKVIKSHPERLERIKAHLYLASLYASYKNPGKDYTRALEHLNRYSLLSPKAAKEYDVQNHLYLLRKIEQLSEEKVKLEQAIEELKLLDQQIEQKRERYR